MTATTMTKRCRRGRVHDDAASLVDHLMSHGGSVAKPNEAIAFDLGFIINRGAGMRQVDMSRFVKARNHVRDGLDGTSPCCGFRLSYRTSARGSEYALIDPSGNLGSHALVAVETLRGWITREAQHHTENLRQVESFESLGEHALNCGDKVGYRLCAKCAMELERDGTVTPATMAEFMVWTTTLKP
jgi:hypothetical protein